MQNKNIFYCLAGIIFLIFFYVSCLSAPAQFVPERVFSIKPGSSLRSVSLKLKEEHIIRSRLAFEALVIIFGGEKHVIGSDYYFENQFSVYEIARRISKGEHHMPPNVVTIPEGFNTNQIADAFAAKLKNFDKAKFLLKAQGLEGYLFPDTYFFLNTDTEGTIISSMRNNFEKKVGPLRASITALKKTEKEIIIMASLVEGEAEGDSDREFISGILWKRLSIGMPLQVDVALETYKAKGLPKTPVGNPGLKAIQAAIHPQKSAYLYYLHDKDGGIHYAKSFAEHKQNVLKYLK